MCLEQRMLLVVFFFFKQKTAYEIVSRDWSSDVCSSDLCVDVSEPYTWVQSIIYRRGVM